MSLEVTTKGEGPYSSSPEARKKYGKTYYEKNKEKILDRNKKYRLDHMDRIKNYSKEWHTKNYEQNKEEITVKNKARNKEYYAKSPEKFILVSARDRSRKLSLPFTIKCEDIVIPTICPVLGIPIFRNTGGKTSSPNSPSLDRIVPNLGYIPSNIQVISQKANMMKSNATEEELRRFAEWVLNTYPRS